VSTLLADSPLAPDSEQPSATEQAAPPGEQSTPPSAPAPDRTCANCDTPIQDDQQWCMRCGMAQPGSLGERTNWRALTALALVAMFLVAGAAVAGAAALNGKGAATQTAPVTVAQVPAPVAPGTTTSPATTPPTPTTPGAPATPGGTTTTTKPPPVGSSGGSSGNFLFPSSTTKPPKIPAPATTPKSALPTTGGSTNESSTNPSETGSSKTNTTTGESKSNGGSTQAEQPSPLLLDTDAASTYNPYHYPDANFGEPALAIDGEASTAWTAQVNPSVAPRMAEGLLVDLKSPTKLGSVKIHTTTPGTTVQIYGAGGSKAPASITDPGWTQLSSSHVLKKTQRVRLSTAGRQYRFLVVWLVKAPAGLTGSGQAPARVSLNEVELFPPAG
jgi:hypothetical protein